MNSEKIKKKVFLHKENENGNEEEKENIKKALLKKAIGFQSSEVIEEYNCENDTGKLMLIKKKITTKQFPPDLDAVQKLMEISEIKNENLSELTDFELEEERKKILQLIKQGELNDDNT